MKNYLFIAMLLMSTTIFSQEKNDTIKISEVVISARNNSVIQNLPITNSVINNDEISKVPINSIDDIFILVPQVNVNRFVGIYGNSTINLQGVGGDDQGRTLILLDGIPLNKADNGGANLNRLNIDDINTVEILYGANSSIYGNNAMGGLVNFISKDPKPGFHLHTKLSYASLNTPMASLQLNDNLVKDNKGLFWKISSFARTSDGYVSQPDSLRDSTSIATFLKELDANATIGYKLSKQSVIKINYDYYTDKRGYGTKILEPQGGYSARQINSLNASYNTNFIGFKFSISPYYQQENYFKNIEKFRKGNYSLIDAKSIRTDYGVLSNFNKNIKNNNLSFGFDYKNGSVNGADVYQTSSDVVKNSGKTNDASAYLSDNIGLFNNKANVFGSLYYDYVNILDNKFVLENPTGETSFMEDFSGNFPNKSFSNLSGKIAFGYKFNNKLSANLSASNGFRTPSLDDMNRSGFFAWGYKEANTNLKPENIVSTNYNLNYKASKINIAANTFYSIGNDFLYFVATGESIFGGKRKVYKKQNIEQVKIEGASISVNYKLEKKLFIFANYSYQMSKILKNNEDSAVVDKQLIYYPNNVANFGFNLNNKYVNIFSSIHYQTKSFIDDANTEELSGFYTVDLKLSRKIIENFKINFSINNLLDNQYIVYFDQLSVGRFYKIEFSYKF